MISTIKSVVSGLPRVPEQAKAAGPPTREPVSYSMMPFGGGCPSIAQLISAILFGSAIIINPFMRKVFFPTTAASWVRIGEPWLMGWSMRMLKAK